jgi:transposase InsO family protein
VKDQCTYSVSYIMGDVFVPAVLRDIPLFTGEEGRGKAQKWLKEINTLGAHNSWPAPYKLTTASKRLARGAYEWYWGEVDDIKTWDDFEGKFKALFVPDAEAAKEDKYEEMLEYAQTTQSSIEYFLTKKGLCRQCDLSFRKTKEKILEKLADRELANILFSKEQTSVDEMYQQIVDYESFRHKRLANRQALRGSQGQYRNPVNSGNYQRQAAGFSNQPQSRETERPNQGPNQRGNFRDSKTTHVTYICFNCCQMGHRIAECPNQSYCDRCKVQGHRRNNCTKNSMGRPAITGQSTSNADASANQGVPPRPPGGQSKHLATNLVETQNQKPEEVHIKDVLINDSGEPVEGFVDTGSSICIIQLMIAVKSKLPLRYDSREIRTYGGMTINTIGTVTADIAIDGVKASGVELNVVPDSAQAWPMLIGRTYTELPHLGYHRDAKFEFYYRKDSPYFGETEPFIGKRPEKVSLKATREVVVLANSVQWLSVSCPDKEAKLLEIKRPLGIGRIFTVEDNKSWIPIVNSSGKDRRIAEQEVVCGARVRSASEFSNEEQTDQANPTQGSSQTTALAPIPRELIDINPNAPAAYVEKMLTLTGKYRDVFAVDITEIGKTDLTEVKINEVPGSRPVRDYRPYKVNEDHRRRIRGIVQQWCQLGLCRPSHSPYGSRTLLVKKKNGDDRLVIDYRKLNKQTVPDYFPLPRLENILERLSKARVYSCLDFIMGYLQIPLCEESKHKTAFITPDGKYEMEVMSFGGKNAPFEYQRTMHSVFQDLLEIILPYFDDVLCPTETFDENLEVLERTFIAIRKSKMTLGIRKCTFGYEETTYLGLVFGQGTVKPNPEKVQVIVNFPEPKNTKELMSFLGVTGFFRGFHPNYARDSVPLTNLLQKETKFKFGPEQKEAFAKLKSNVTSDPVLRLYDPDAPTQLHTDASKEGIGSMLLQEDSEGKLHLVYAISKKNNCHERNYHSSKLELWAIVYSVRRLRNFLIGRHFSIITDCQALIYMKGDRECSSSQILNWLMQLEEFDFEVTHRAGIKMAHVDALSRVFPKETSETTAGNAAARFQISTSGTVLEITTATGAEKEEEMSLTESPMSTSTKSTEEENSMSSNASAEVLLTLSEEDQMVMIQRSDPQLRKIIEILSKPGEKRNREEESAAKEFILKGRHLLRKFTDPKTNEVRELYVMPLSMRKSICVKFHDLRGHGAVRITVDNIRQKVWFKGMTRYVKNHVGQCFDCLLNKRPGGKQPGLLNVIPSPEGPFQCVHIDHLGPFVRSVKGNVHLLVIQDRFSRFVRLYPVRSTNTKTSLKKLEEYTLERGLMQTLISDRGTSFTAKEFKKWGAERGIKHVLNSPRHPQGNGIVERVNRVLIPMIAIKISRPDLRDWDTLMAEVERDVNNSVNRVTGRTPFEIVYGFQPHFKGETPLERILKLTEQPKYKPSSALWETVRQRVAQEQAKIKEYYDRRHYKAEGFFVGDMVVMSAPPPQTGEPRKSSPKYRGPLTIIAVLPGDTYRVAEVQTSPEEKKGYNTTAHISQLKVFRPSHSVDEGDDDQQEDPDDEKRNNDQTWGPYQQESDDDAYSTPSQSPPQSPTSSPGKSKRGSKKRTASEATINPETPHRRRGSRKKTKNTLIYNDSFLC